MIQVKFQYLIKYGAVSIIPDVSWLTKRQNEMSEDDWNEIVIDMDYYTYEAEEALEKHGIPTYFAPREKICQIY
jgi:hypothetical protein